MKPTLVPGFAALLERRDAAAIPPVRSDPLLAWSVHVVVCGLYVGAYKFDTEAEARADADDRRRKFGVLGCRYIVEANQQISGPPAASARSEGGAE